MKLIFLRIRGRGISDILLKLVGYLVVGFLIGVYQACTCNGKIFLGGITLIVVFTLVEKLKEQEIIEKLIKRQATLEKSQKTDKKVELCEDQYQ